MDQQAIAEFQGNFGAVFMTAMDGIARLKRGNGSPAVRLKQRAGFRRPGELRPIPLRIRAFAQRGDGAAEQHLGLIEQFGHSGVCGVGGAKNLFGLKRFIVAVFILDHHGGDQLPAFIIHQSDAVAHRQPVRLLQRYREGDGDRPEGSIGKVHGL